MGDQRAMNNFHTFQTQCDLLMLQLQLAEGDEEEPKRSGVFKSTYRNAAGNEVTITRTPDGRFGSKSGESSASSSTTKTPSPGTETKPSDGIDITQIAKDVLNGKLGDEFKENISNSVKDARIKVGIQQAKFSEILGSGKNAISSAEKYIGDKFNECVKSTNDLQLCSNMGKILVAALVTAGVTGAIAASIGAPALAGGSGMLVGAYVATTIVGNQISATQKKNKNAEMLKDLSYPQTWMR